MKIYKRLQRITTKIDSKATNVKTGKIVRHCEYICVVILFITSIKLKISDWEEFQNFNLQRTYADIIWCRLVNLLPLTKTLLMIFLCHYIYKQPLESVDVLQNFSSMLMTIFKLWWCYLELTTIHYHKQSNINLQEKGTIITIQSKQNFLHLFFSSACNPF